VTALALVTGGSDAERAVDLFILYDTVSGFPRSITTVFEHHAPGAEAALLTWASARGYAVDVRCFRSNSDNALIAVTEVIAAGGATLNVQRTITHEHTHQEQAT
jgi:hypothetical protein